MAFSFVQAVSANASGGTSVTTAGISSTTGNLFVCVAGCTSGRSFATPSFTDSETNSYTDVIDVSNGGARCKQGYVANGAGGAGHTFTANFLTADYAGIIASEFVANSGTSLDVFAGGGAGSATTSHASNTTGTTSEAAELLVGGFNTDDNAGEPFTPTNDWILPTNGYLQTGNDDTALCYKIVSSVGAYNFTCTTNGSCRSAMNIGTFKEAAGGGGGDPEGSLLGGKLLRGGLLRHGVLGRS